MSVAWAKPHAAITHYTLRVVDSGGNAVLENERLDADVTSYTIRQLQPGTQAYSQKSAVGSCLRDLWDSPIFRRLEATFVLLLGDFAIACAKFLYANTSNEWGVL